MLVLDCLDVLSPLYLFDYLQHKAPFSQAGNKCFLMQLRGLGLWRLDKRLEPSPLTGTERLRAEHIYSLKPAASPSPSSVEEQTDTIQPPRPTPPGFPTHRCYYFYTQFNLGNISQETCGRIPHFRRAFRTLRGKLGLGEVNWGCGADYSFKKILDKNAPSSSWCSRSFFGMTGG